MPLDELNAPIAKDIAGQSTDDEEHPFCPSCGGALFVRRGKIPRRGSNVGCVANIG